MSSEVGTRSTQISNPRYFRVLCIRLLHIRVAAAASQTLYRTHVALRRILQSWRRSLHVGGQLAQGKLGDDTVQPSAQFDRQFHDTGFTDTPAIALPGT